MTTATTPARSNMLDPLKAFKSCPPAIVGSCSGVCEEQEGKVSGSEEVEGGDNRASGGRVRGCLAVAGQV